MTIGIIIYENCEIYTTNLTLQIINIQLLLIQNKNILDIHILYLNN